MLFEFFFFWLRWEGPCFCYVMKLASHSSCISLYFRRQEDKSPSRCGEWMLGGSDRELPRHAKKSEVGITIHVDDFTWCAKLHSSTLKVSLFSHNDHNTIHDWTVVSPPQTLLAVSAMAYVSKLTLCLEI